MDLILLNGGGHPMSEDDKEWIYSASSCWPSRALMSFSVDKGTRDLMAIILWQG